MYMLIRVDRSWADLLFFLLGFGSAFILQKFEIASVMFDSQTTFAMLISDDERGDVSREAGGSRTKFLIGRVLK